MTIKKFTEEQVKNACLQYKDQNYKEPTHLFIYSSKQEATQKKKGMPLSKVHGCPYTECRKLSRLDLGFLEDAKIVAAGCIEDTQIIFRN